MPIKLINNYCYKHTLANDVQSNGLCNFKPDIGNSVFTQFHEDGDNIISKLMGRHGPDFNELTSQRCECLSPNPDITFPQRLYEMLHKVSNKSRVVGRVGREAVVQSCHQIRDLVIINLISLTNFV